MSTAAPLLTLERLSVRYGRIVALEEVDLEVRSGELVTLLGSNGAGKSTTLKAISQLVDPSGGAVLARAAPEGGGHGNHRAPGDRPLPGGPPGAQPPERGHQPGAGGLPAP